MGFTTQSDTFRGYQEKPPYILSGDFGLRKFIIFFGKTTEQLPLGSQKLQIINEMQNFGKFYEEDSPESDHFRLASFPYEFKSTKKYWHGQPLPTLLAMPGFLRISVRQSTLQPLRLIEGFFASAGFAELTAADS